MKSNWAKWVYFNGTSMTPFHQTGKGNICSLSLFAQNILSKFQMIKQVIPVDLLLNCCVRSRFSVLKSHLPPTPHSAWTWYGPLSLIHSPVHSATFLRLTEARVVFQMDVLAVPADRQKGWYLSLMAPNVKGPTFAWLDPSRLYCNSQVLQLKNKFLLAKRFQGQVFSVSMKT